jgi:hypothetical protein
LDKAVKASTSASDAVEVLSQVDVSMQPTNTIQSGWDAFTLAYNIQPPLNVVFSTDVMASYAKIHSLLFKIKRTELALVEHGTITRCIDPILYKCNFLTYEMKNFVRNLMIYMNTEVVEQHWAEMIRQVEAAEDVEGI